MSPRSDGEVPVTETLDGQSGGRAPRVRRRRRQVAVAVATVGGLVLVPQALPSSGSALSGAHATSASIAAPAAAAAALQPPAGKSWIQGALTDQAGHRLDNVNVEVWPMDLTAIAPVASNLSYAGDTPDRQSGVFRLEVPAGTPYRITFSTILGQEDGDPYRMLAYGGGGPIMTRTNRIAAAAAVVAAPGRIINLGSVSLARQGLVSSAITAQLAKRKIAAGRRGTVRVQVTSPYVSSVAGNVQVRASGKRVVRRVTAFDQGSLTIKLPRLKRGAHGVGVSFLGSTTVAPSKATPLRIVVSPKKKKR